MKGKATFEMVVADSLRWSASDERVFWEEEIWELSGSESETEFKRNEEA
jgi:hypothetical protein